MSHKNPKAFHGITCGIFKKEIEKIQKELDLNIQFEYFNSMLHMKPEILDDVLNKKLQERDDNVLLIYGDCQPHMGLLEEKENVKRIGGINCCEILLGHDDYFRLRNEGAFFLLPEWTIRWREVFIDHLGFNESTGKAFMQDMHKKLIYLDTGVQEIPIQLLKEVSTFCGLPYEILKIPLTHLRESLIKMSGQ